MCRLLEAIRYENGRFDHLKYHRQRMSYARKMLFGLGDEPDLPGTLLKAEKEQFPGKKHGIFKCRVVYDSQIREIRFLPYVLPVIRSLRLVRCDDLDYSLKYEDRSRLNLLFGQRGGADDILIVKNGWITDTSFCNVLFFNGKQWLTPEHPLLKGTQRAALLEMERIGTARISPGDLKLFSGIRLINAMIRFEDKLDIPMENVNW